MRLYQRPGLVLALPPWLPFSTARGGDSGMLGLPLGRGSLEGEGDPPLWAEIGCRWKLGTETARGSLAVGHLPSGDSR